MECILDGLLHTTFALTITGRHDGDATVLQHGLHIVEVEVDESVNGDDLCNRLGSHTQGVVGLSESIEHREFRIYLTQAFIINY